MTESHKTWLKILAIAVPILVGMGVLYGRFTALEERVAGNGNNLASLKGQIATSASELKSTLDKASGVLTDQIKEAKKALDERITPVDQCSKDNTKALNNLRTVATSDLKELRAFLTELKERVERIAKAVGEFERKTAYQNIYRAYSGALIAL